MTFAEIVAYPMLSLIASNVTYEGEYFWYFTETQAPLQILLYALIFEALRQLSTQIYNYMHDKAKSGKALLSLKEKALLLVRLFVLLISASSIYVIYEQDFMQANHDWTKDPRSKLAERFARSGDMQSAYIVDPFYSIENNAQYILAKKLSKQNASSLYSIGIWAKDHDLPDAASYITLAEKSMLDEFQHGNFDVLATERNIQAWSFNVERPYQLASIKNVTTKIQAQALKNAQRTCSNAEKAYWFSLLDGNETVKNNFKAWADSISKTQCNELYKINNGGLNGFFIYN